MAGKRTGSRGTGSRLQHEPTEHARNYAQIAYEFAVEASRDKGTRHCKWVRLAAKRHLNDLKRAGKRGCPFYFEPWWANDICDFAEKFPHVEGEWDTANIELEPPQIFILASVFGWRRKGTGRRRFTKAYIEAARKFAKSTLSAIVAHYCLACEGSVGPQVVIGATTGEQALKVFRPAKLMAEKLPDYRDEFGVECFVRSITCAESGGFIQPINAKSSTQDGWNPQVGILDELHAHKDRGLYDVIRSAFGSRKSPLMWIITTAGYNIAGVCYEQHLETRKILEDVIQADHVFGIIFTLDEGDDPHDERKWIKANPLLGVTPTLESMREFSIEAKSSPQAAGEFKTKRCNIWTSAKSAWLNMEFWPRQNGADIDYAALRDITCFGGLDLASVSDIAAFVLIWMHAGRLKFRGRYYLPEETVRPRTERGNVPYQTWVDQGWLTTTPGETIDYDFIERDIDEARDSFAIKEIGFDKWNSTQVVNNLLDKNAPMVQVRQGSITYNAPMLEFERLWIRGAIDHGGDPVMRWMLSNVVARMGLNNDMAPDRKNSHEKIDGPVSLLMAMARAMTPPTTKPSKYKHGARLQSIGA
jgi:phage terminase large subunit-like protein